MKQTDTSLDERLADLERRQAEHDAVLARLRAAFAEAGRGCLWDFPRTDEQWREWAASIGAQSGDKEREA